MAEIPLPLLGPVFLVKKYPLPVQYNAKPPRVHELLSL